jgi:ribosomal protein S27AE
MTEKIEREECVKCGEELDVIAKEEDRTPCPKCGSIGRKRIGVFNEKVVIKQSGMIQHETQKRIISYPLLVVSFVIVLVSTFSVYYVTNSELSVIVGIIFGFISFLIGAYAIDNRITRTREKF